MTDDERLEREIAFEEIRRDFLLTLELLRLIPPNTVITCHCCGGAAPGPEFCGCDGTQTVAEAIAFVESQLEVLSK